MLSIMQLFIFAQSHKVLLINDEEILEKENIDINTNFSENELNKNMNETTKIKI